VAAIVQLAVGGIWNGLLFNRAFYATHEVKEGLAPKLPQALLMVILTFVNSFILAILFRNLQVSSAANGIMLALVLWLALLVPFIVGTGFATGRSKAIPLELGHTLLAMLAAGLVLGLMM
jgi:hypothetical protein